MLGFVPGNSGHAISATVAVLAQTTGHDVAASQCGTSSAEGTVKLPTRS